MNKTIKRLSIIPLLFIVLGCSTQGNSHSEDSHPDNSDPNQINAESRLLRSPEGLNHSVDESELRSPEYLSFKSKIKNLASRVSESFASREYKENENVTISPLSIEMCLGLAIASANGETREELLDLFDLDYETFNRYYHVFFNELSHEIYGYEDELISQILLTNSIWLDNGASLLDNGLDHLRNDYYCYSYEVDFDEKNAASNKAIQEFIEEKTKGLIKPTLNLSPETLFVLMNTLYLKDIWNEGGLDLSYMDDSYTFKNNDGTISNKKLLTGGYFGGKALSNDSGQAFFTSTLNGLTLYLLKPNDGVSLTSLLSKDNILEFTNRNNYTFKDEDNIYFTRCIFPEFEAETNIDLKPMFVDDLNINKIFTDECDFTNLTYTPVSCSDFRHIAKLKVNKGGIEGAAVTMMSYEGTSIDEDPRKKVYEDFLVDHSFAYVLTYHDSVLFSGITTNIDK